MIDTHCHLNFKAFKKSLDSVISEAQNAGVEAIVIPGTDIKNSKRAIEICRLYDGLYCSVGLHPHHVYDILMRLDRGESQSIIVDLLNEIAQLSQDKTVVAIGEIGIDLHYYAQTKYEKYAVDERFVSLQKELFVAQLEIASSRSLPVIIHNREASSVLLDILKTNSYPRNAHRMVFHCCEPDPALLEYAKQHTIYIGCDGDITFIPEKQDFLSKIPLDLLVFETDAPFLLPEPLRSKKLYPNKPANVSIVAKYFAQVVGVPYDNLVQTTTRNARRLFEIK